MKTVVALKSSKDNFRICSAIFKSFFGFLNPLYKCNITNHFERKALIWFHLETKSSDSLEQKLIAMEIENGFKIER